MRSLSQYEPFRPIRHFYRGQIAMLIPAHLGVSLNAYGDTLTLDNGFLGLISDQVPEAHRNDFNYRIECINLYLRYVVPSDEEIGRIAFRMQSHLAVRHVNALLVRFDYERQAAGLCTWNQLIKHCLGIEQCHLPF